MNLSLPAVPPVCGYGTAMKTTAVSYLLLLNQETHTQHIKYYIFIIPPTFLIFFFLYFADRASQYIYLNINQLDALNFIMSLFHASTCFEQHVLIVRRAKLYYTASGIITLKQASSLK